MVIRNSGDTPWFIIELILLPKKRDFQDIKEESISNIYKLNDF